MAGVCRQEIKALVPGCQNSIVIGVVIGSLNPKTFEAHNQKFGNGGMRGVWTFTIRDSVEDSINVTVWGGVEYISNLFRNHRIGCVVEIISAKVTMRQMDDKNEAFVPSVTSTCYLTVNEGTALIQAHDSPAYAQYAALQYLPFKDPSELRSLKYILENIDSLRDQYISILVIVGQAQYIMTKDGRNVSYRVFDVADGSTDEITQLRIWEEEWIRISELWDPKRTVLFISDARVAFDNYKKKNAISIARKTVFTVNPNIPEVSTLRNSFTGKSEMEQNDPFVLPNSNSITTVMTIQEITGKLHSVGPAPDKRLQFFTILYATITDINLEDSNPNFLVTKCALCKRRVKENYDSCMNIECPCGVGAKVPINVVTMTLKINLKDDTGYLISCRLSGSAAESALGCTAEDVQKMSPIDIQKLKWELIMSKYEIRLQVLGSTIAYRHAIYNILSMKKIDDDEDNFLNELINI